MPTKITVLLVDDHALVRRGFRRLLEDDPGLEVVGEASDGDDAVKQAIALRPQIVVMDCAMPGTSGLSPPGASERAPNTAVLMLSMHSEARWRVRLWMPARGAHPEGRADLTLRPQSTPEGQTVLDPKLVQPSALRGSVTMASRRAS
jgi:DNA-binding NarL/FixJ family response regulator